LNTAGEREDTVAFFKQKDTKTYDLALSQALEQIQGNIQWIEVRKVGDSHVNMKTESNTTSPALDGRCFRVVGGMAEEKILMNGVCQLYVIFMRYLYTGHWPIKRLRF
jgi:hypothetical protein